MNIRSIVAVAVALSISPGPASAQEARTTPTHAFLSGGLGVGTRDIAGQLAVTVSTDNGDWVLRVSETSEFNIFSPSASVRDVALLYGRRRSGARGWVRASVGAGVVRVVYVGEARNCFFFSCDYSITNATSVGLALQADAVWAPSKVIGLGLGLLGNLNPEDPFLGLTLALHLGRLR